MSPRCPSDEYGYLRLPNIVRYHILSHRGTDIMRKWDRRFLDVANVVATWSKDPSTKVGAVIVRNKRIVSTGYNGFPPQIEDNPKDYSNRETKYGLVIHAEMNAILNARGPVDGCTLYLTPLPPCIETCAKMIAAANIVRVVCDVDVEKSKSVKYTNFDATEAFFKKAGIEYLWL